MSTQSPFIDPVKPERIGATQPLGDESKMNMPTQSFQSYMQSPGANPLVASNSSTVQMSPFDLVHGPNALQSGPNLQTLLGQVTSAQTTLGDLSNHLNTPNLRLRQSQRYILKNKLTDANSHLRSASIRLGAREVPPVDTAMSGNPIVKFLGLVTSGQDQLKAAQSQIEALNANGQNLNPADLMLVQVKLSQAQNQLQYASILLSQVVEDIKMLFGVQL